MNLRTTALIIGLAVPAIGMASMLDVDHDAMRATTTSQASMDAAGRASEVRWDMKVPVRWSLKHHDSDDGDSHNEHGNPGHQGEPDPGTGSTPSASVPEPSGFALMGLMGVGLLMAGRLTRRKRSAAA